MAEAATADRHPDRYRYKRYLYRARDVYYNRFRWLDDDLKHDVEQYGRHGCRGIIATPLRRHRLDLGRSAERQVRYRDTGDIEGINGSDYDDVITGNSGDNR